MVTIRKPAVAGQFYNARKEDLIDSIKDCFLDKRGPGSFPKISKKLEKPCGIVVPHAGYMFSGAIAAHSFKFILEQGLADTYIIIGPNHTGAGSGLSVMKEGEWLTPLGKVAINENIANSIHKDIIDSDIDSHLYEHSIEVQIPFLQYILKDNEFDIVPISMGIQDKKTSKEVGDIIAEVIKTSKNKIALIASSDFSHVGFNYMTMPPADTRVDKYAESQDKLAIDKILKLDSNGLIDTVEENNITMCGYGPVATIINALKYLGASKAELLKYGTSYEVHPSDSCVGYGSIAIF